MMDHFTILKLNNQYNIEGRFLMNKEVLRGSLIIAVLLMGIFTGYQAYYNIPENWITWLNSSFQCFKLK